MSLCNAIVDEVTVQGAWVGLNKGKREIIETADGIPPPNQDLIILGGYLAHEQAEEKMNEDQQQRSASWR